MSLVVTLAFGGCFRAEVGEQFYGSVAVPASQEFRWSDGGLPKIFDPARAAAPPDTDAVRALFEGLTDYEPGALRPVPAVAARWDSADGGRSWTFRLRTDARWSNGDAVTAEDFVRSWQRTLRLGERAPHAKLLANIEGAQDYLESLRPPSQKGAAEGAEKGARSGLKVAAAPTPTPQQQFGAVALDAHTLRVTLKRPDKNFPALVAHPVFRPVHELSYGAELKDLRDEQSQSGDAGLVTNGAFSLSQLAGDSVELRRADNYWDAQSVRLDRVLFVDKPDAEGALAAYRAGDVDAVTNAPVEPLAVKLLTPYKDFRRGTFAALNYYRFNTSRPPFDDRRVRESLALALDTVRLSADTLGGATEPADRFLPTAPEEDAGRKDSSSFMSRATSLANADRASLVEDESRAESGDSGSAPAGSSEKDSAGAGDGESRGLAHDVKRARSLLAEAGYPGGRNFPRIRLLVNRNEQQRLVAQAVARMWREALGVETDVVVRPWEEYEAMLRSGDYDIARRSLVMQTTDEESNMIELFGDDAESDEGAASSSQTSRQPPSSTQAGASVAAPDKESPREPPVLTEAEALRELPAIPLHFASSYALVKPYVEGFETNLLDAPSLKSVHINTEWQPPRQEVSPVVAR